MRLRLSSLLVSMTPAILFAQQAPTQQPAGNPLIQIVPMMAIMFAVIYFLMIRPEQKKSKTRQKMMDEIKKGDKVVTIGGAYGVVHSVKDGSILIKIADNTVVEFRKNAVADVVVDKSDDGAAKPDKK